MIKNRIHTLLDRYHVPTPAVSDIFGKRGRDYLAKVELPAAAQELLRQDLALLEPLLHEVRATEQWLRDSVRGDHRVELLRTIPGLGDLLATVVALEIDRIERFASAAKLAAYAGLVPTTYSSGRQTFHGKLMAQTNKWSRWALVEAAWVAVRLDPYFRAHFANRRAHKPAQIAIIATARRLLEVVWHVLKRGPPVPEPTTGRFATEGKDFLGCPSDSRVGLLSRIGSRGSNRYHVLALATKRRLI
jgi:transposase